MFDGSMTTARTTLKRRLTYSNDEDDGDEMPREYTYQDDEDLELDPDSGRNMEEKPGNRLVDDDGDVQSIEAYDDAQEKLSDWNEAEMGDSNLAEIDEAKLEPFNIEEELREGRFDKKTGDYVPNKRPSYDEDTWLLNITPEEMKRARDAEERRNPHPEKTMLPTVSQKDLIESLVTYLGLGENATEALVRRKPTMNIRKFDARNRRMAISNNHNNNNNASAEEKIAESRRREQIENITEICLKLVDLGMFDIYETTREELQRQLKNLS